MSVYIEHDDLVRRISSVARLAKSDAQKALLGRVIYITEHAPAVDAVCVVRCKDCKNWDEDSGICYENSSCIYRFLSEEDFYCKAGCKKDGNDFDVG